jgi:hypothetical protein
VGQLSGNAPAVPGLVAQECELVFTEKDVPVGKSKVHLTDHFGVFGKIKVLGR